MSVLHLENLLAPRSIAVLGASNREDSVGAVLFRNLLSGGYAGPLLLGGGPPSADSDG